MAKKQKVISLGRETITNNYISSDGELLHTEKDVKHHKILITDKDKFALVFSEIMGVIDDLEKGEVRLLVWCSQNCLINTNVINLGSGYRKIIRDMFNVSDQTIKNAVVGLKKKGILIPNGSATYIIHPKYFWRGDLGLRKKYILELGLIEKDNSMKNNLNF